MIGANPEQEVAQIMEWRKNKEAKAANPFDKIAPQEKSAADTIGSTAMTSGDPKAMAIGAGLKVLAAKEARERQYRDSLYQNEQMKIAGQQSAIQNLLQMARGLKL